MPAVHEKSLLFARFLASDPRHWVRFLPALPSQAAYYHDAHIGGDVLHRFLLLLTGQGGPGQHSCRVALEIGSHTVTSRGLIFDVASTARDVPIALSGLNFAGAKWPALRDPLVRKARDIVVMCSDKYGPPPAALPVYLH